ncbi:hypothetical protein Ppa06_46360 [Planomonospora parontospora subsp. parontospora]|uniref:Uncharacterized protein n=2 Tax=Planomonospora parontospora TaxID=58119 RepID=A0AA37BKX6_9ACTN|nr:hypothetical protein [Planomonospora parontospora]GGK86478.1 hypothetical protein GCM10010126_52170 [Planomonospora parontospora]GII10838.1 hypothetical protein Ppa06_46360 [Planomonospora parontospora subsp. parontospora]
MGTAPRASRPPDPAEPEGDMRIVIRRDILRERDLPGATNIGLIDVVVRYALDSGYHVVLEGILYADRYGAMLQTLRADHLGSSHCYYLDVPFAETL